MTKFYVTIYNTNKCDFDIDRYLTNSMKVKFENDIQPIFQYQCATYEEANFLYHILRVDNNVVAKFQGRCLLCVTNKNHLYV